MKLDSFMRCVCYNAQVVPQQGKKTMFGWTDTWKWSYCQLSFIRICLHTHCIFHHHLKMMKICPRWIFNILKIGYIRNRTCIKSRSSPLGPMIEVDRQIISFTMDVTCICSGKGILYRYQMISIFRQFTSSLKTFIWTKLPKTSD